MSAASIGSPQIARGRFRPEPELLFTSVAGAPTAARWRHIDALLAQPLDWEFLLHFADQHGLTALFFWSAQNFQHAIPAQCLNFLGAAYETNARKNLLFWHLLLEVQELLASHDVECIALKGPTLAAGVYGNVALREFSDVDILVRPCDVARARSVLMLAGFSPALDVHPKHEHAYVKSANELAFHRGSHRNILELQWQITPRFYAVDFNIQELFQRATLTRLGDAHSRTLSSEDLLLISCVHGAKHAWARLAWICDIAWLLRNQPPNWHEVEHRAERLGIERILLVALALARNFFQTSLPSHLEAEIQGDPKVRALSREVEESILCGERINVTHPSYFLMMCR